MPNQSQKKKKKETLEKIAGMFKVIKKDTERRQRHYSLIFIFNFQQISHLTVVLTYLTWTSRITTG